MEESEPTERKIKYKGVSPIAIDLFENETLTGLLEALEADKKDGLLRIMISEREVGTLRIENKKIYIQEVVDETPQEIEILKKYSVYGPISLKAIFDKYLDSIADDLVEDTKFLEKIRKEGESRNPDNREFILLLWGRYWNVSSRFHGDSKDGIYLVSERDIYKEGDENTFLSKS